MVFLLFFCILDDDAKDFGDDEDDKSVVVLTIELAELVELAVVDRC